MGTWPDRAHEALLAQGGLYADLWNRQQTLENYGRGAVMENERTRGNFNVMCRLVGLVKPLAPVMVCAVLLGVAGFLCAIFIPVLGVYALLDTLLAAAPIALAPYVFCCRFWP